MKNNEKSSKTYSKTVLLSQNINQINDMNQRMPSALQPFHNATRNSIHDNKVQPQIQTVNKDSSLSSSTTDKEWISVIKHKRVNSSRVGTGKQQNTSSGIQGALKKSGYILGELENIYDDLAPVSQRTQFDVKKLQTQLSVFHRKKNMIMFLMKTFGQRVLYLVFW
ncbi:hypothetical protein WA026_021356 [Henosepilachna vigintioctopunctata]|uniref:Uncharacterized protein n=1 Tax=Henosepilachna vigintioctopunctata TaxID=420089 RepID=A0AAW1TWZ7_9CUCU